MKLRPLLNRILVLPLPSETQTAGGILLPENAKERPQKGQIVAMGPGKLNEMGYRLPMSVAVDDLVLYGKYTGSEIEQDGTKYLVMTDDDVLAVLEG